MKILYKKLQYIDFVEEVLRYNFVPDQFSCQTNREQRVRMIVGCALQTTLSFKCRLQEWSEEYPN